METKETAIERKGFFARWRQMRAERPEVPRFWCAVLMLLAMACLAITASGNLQFSDKMALTDGGRLTMQAQALVVDGLAVALVGISGFLFHARRYIPSFILFIFAAGYVSLSASGLIGWGIGERVGSTALVEAQQLAVQDATEAQNDEALKERRELLAMLRAKFNSRRTSERERAIITNKLAELATTPIQIKAAKIETVVADGQAKVVGKALGFDVETVQMAFMAAYGGAIVLGKILGAWCATAFWPRKPLAVWGWLRRSRREEEAPAVLTTAEAVAAMDAVPEPAPALPKPASAAAIDLDREREKALVKEFFESQTARVAPTTTAKANDVYNWFRDWCQRSKKLGSVMTLTRFGRLTVELDYAKERDKGRIVYRGLARKAAPAIPVGAPQPERRKRVA